jgi:hypothetical protein
VKSNRVSLFVIDIKTTKLERSIWSFVGLLACQWKGSPLNINDWKSKKSF